MEKEKYQSSFESALVVYHELNFSPVSSWSSYFIILCADELQEWQEATQFNIDPRSFNCTKDDLLELICKLTRSFHI